MFPVIVPVVALVVVKLGIFPFPLVAKPILPLSFVHVTVDVPGATVTVLIGAVEPVQ